MKLWVDDIRDPANHRPGEDWHWVKTVTEAIRILDTQDVDEVSLDHDISYKVSIGHGDPRPFCAPETFEPVARFISARYGRDGMRKITLHTANSVGAEKMREILSKTGITVEIRLSLPCNRWEES